MKNKSAEDYLKQIYCIGAREDRVTTSSIAEKLSISPASVTDMIQKLGREGYVSYEKYQGVRLTGKGEQLALRVIRRHRLIELFLVTVLKYSWDNVHEEAERLEHVVSDEMERRIDEFLGFPKYDPHGDPIPSDDGILESVDAIRLSELEPGDRARILRVTDSKQLLQLMKKMNLELNHTLDISEKESFDDSMTVSVEGKKRQFLSRDVTHNIFVRKIRPVHERKKYQ
jgi:DtxR family Mn-dependent transcriptional regulator